MYLSGFGNYHATEARENALPKNQNSPQQCPFGLYAEQLNGSAFTRPRVSNLYSWLYRQQPSAAIHPFQPYPSFIKAIADKQPPNPMRWSPLDNAYDGTFLEGLFHFVSNNGSNGYFYRCQKSMENTYFQSRDGEWLFIPYKGKMRLRTEMGHLFLEPGTIAVIPRGIYFAIDVLDDVCAGYICENSKHPFILPELGPLGANALAQPRHFLYPKAAYETASTPVELFCKYQNQLWISKNNTTPLNVVAWHGRYAPYLYDLSHFNTINTVSFDHPDPSIFTVLTSPSDTTGVAHLDFVIFPPRWMVAEHTFRLPYFHRNIMSEWMGLIQGQYDAKKDGFLPGGSSLHNCMTGHGPDVASYKACIEEVLAPQRYNDTLAFMLESSTPWQVTQAAFAHPSYQEDYASCWQGFPMSKG